VSYTFEDVYFDFDQATITREGQARLQEVGAILITIPGADIELHGHTCNIGAADYNMDLSQRRAESVQKYLLDNFSQLRADQFTIRAFGLTQPAATNETLEGRRMNRRVEIKHITG
jgi:OmpA-OmpF porin, OOP family